MENNKATDFESSMQRLEEIVALLENGNTSLETSVALFEEGTKLAVYCNSMLDQAEQKVCILKKNVDGTPITDCKYED